MTSLRNFPSISIFFFSICKGKTYHKGTRIFLKEKKTQDAEEWKSKTKTQFHRQLETEKGREEKQTATKPDKEQRDLILPLAGTCLRN